MATGFELLALVVTVATALSIIARKTSQPAVIAYILTGLILGKAGLDIVAKTEITGIFSELGLVFLLFFIGLEIDLGNIKKIIKPVSLIALPQMAMTFLFGFSLGGILGFSLPQSIFFGAASMFSSTALVIKLLEDRDQASSLHGRLDTGILLIQDVAVVLVLAMMTANFSSPLSFSLRLAEILFLIGVTAAISIASSRYMLPKIFSRISENKHAFFIYGIAWAFLFISGAEYFGLSLEIGAFFAGLSLAQLPYSSELQERVRPLTELFMAVFFVNFGLEILPGHLSAFLLEAVVASLFLMVAKAIIIFSLVDRLNFTPETSFKASINMTQVSEFSLIMAAVAASQGFISGEFLGFISIVALATMAASSYLVSFNSEIFLRVEEYLERFSAAEERNIQKASIENHALVIGYNRVVKRVLQELEREYEQIVIVDNDPENVEELSRLDHEYIYGDFKHGEIRNSSGLKQAELVLSFSRDKNVNHHILNDRKRGSVVFLEAKSFEKAAELYEQGAEYVIIENVITGEKVADYLELYLKDPELFREETQDDLETIYWGGRDG
ncbi:MAG: cation:proton antiporter [Candidatus Nanohaloarchaea archaeon]